MPHYVGPMQASFSHVDTWIFDLDNTLYHPSARLFDQIEVKMRAYVMRELGVDQATADRLRTEYWHRYGTTLAGLMQRHQMDPEPFMLDVHDIDLSHMSPEPALAQAISALPGRKIVYTNGSRLHAERVTAARGLDHVFDDMFGVEHAGWVPKPHRAAFDTVFALADISPSRSAFFEDETRNLEQPKAMGMTTVLVGDSHHAPYVDYRTDALADFLSRMVSDCFPNPATNPT